MGRNQGISIFISLLLTILQSWPLVLHAQEDQIYTVLKITDSIAITGKGDAAIWDKALLLTNFQIYWDDEIAQPTSFRALWTDDYFYFLYQAIDHDIVTSGATNDKRSVIYSDRVELFFKSKGKMDPYYCLELDPRGRVLDYESRLYRKFDFYWEWPDPDIDVKTSINDQGYTVEGKIKISSLQLLGALDEENVMEVGLFRGDFYHYSPGKTAVKWISWVQAKSVRPDFHISSAFGKFKLDKLQ